MATKQGYVQSRSTFLTDDPWCSTNGYQTGICTIPVNLSNRRSMVFNEWLPNRDTYNPGQPFYQTIHGVQRMATKQGYVQSRSTFLTDDPWCSTNGYQTGICTIPVNLSNRRSMVFNEWLPNRDTYNPGQPF